MAYVSYSPARDFHGVKNAVSAPIVMRSALVAAAAAIAILALSEASVTSTAAPTVAAKGDRVAAAFAALPVASGAGYYTDVAARTTTVERGATVPLTAESPLVGVGN